MFRHLCYLKLCHFFDKYNFVTTIWICSCKARFNCFPKIFIVISIVSKFSKKCFFFSEKVNAVIFLLFIGWFIELCFFLKKLWQSLKLLLKFLFINGIWFNRELINRSITIKTCSAYRQKLFNVFNVFFL